MGAFISILFDLDTTTIILFLLCFVMWLFDSSHTENESSPENLPLQSVEDLQERLPTPVQCQEDIDALGSPGTNASVCDSEQTFNTGLTESTCKATCGSDDGSEGGELDRTPQSSTVSHIDDAHYPIQSQEDVDQGVDSISIHSNADGEHDILDDDSSQIATSVALTNDGGGRDGEFSRETSEGTAAWLKHKPPEALQIRGRHSLVNHEDDTSQRVHMLMGEIQRLRAFQLCKKCKQLPFCFVLFPCGHLLCWQCVTRKKCPICDWQINSWYPAILP